MATPILTSLSGSVPGQDEEALRRARAAQQVQLQQQLGQTSLRGTGLSAARAAQRLAPGAITAAAGVEAAGLQQQQELAGQRAGTELARQRRETGAAVERERTAQGETLKTAEREQYEQLADEHQDTRRRITRADIAEERRLSQLGLDLDNDVFFLTDQQRKDLAALDESLVRDVFDRRRVFEQDEMGRKFSNEQQLQDWALASASSRQEFMDRSQQIQNEMRKEQALFEYALRDMSAVLKRGYMVRKGDLDGASKERLVNMKQDMEDMLRAKQDEAKAQQDRIKTFAYIGETVASIF